jgi:hypothetical protein
MRKVSTAGNDPAQESIEASLVMKVKAFGEEQRELLKELRSARDCYLRQIDEIDQLLAELGYPVTEGTTMDPT